MANRQGGKEAFHWVTLLLVAMELLACFMYVEVKYMKLI